MVMVANGLASPEASTGMVMTEPNSVVNSGSLALALIWTLRELVPPLAKRLNLIPRDPPRHRTFADDPDQYWTRMRETVTEPLAKVLDKQTDALNDVLRELASFGGPRRIKGR